MPRRPAAPSSILVYVGVDLLGDAMMKLPFVRALRAAFPQARITWLAGKGKTVFAGILAPLVDGLIDEVIEEAGIGSRWPELLAPRPLDGRRFDLVIDTQRRVLTTLILRRIRHGAFLSGAARWLLSDIRPRGRWVKPAAMADQVLELVELASGRPAQALAPLPRHPASDVEALRLLPDGPVYVGLMPGAGGQHRFFKFWPLDRYVALARRQAAAGRVPVMLLGPAERGWEEGLRERLPEALFPLAEDSDVLLTVALGRRLALCVANDSGGAHLIAASGVPLVSLWGPTMPAKATPLGSSRVRVIRAQDFGGHEMDAIPLDAVAAAVEEELARR